MVVVWSWEVGHSWEVAKYVALMPGVAAVGSQIALQRLVVERFDCTIILSRLATQICF